ncbi:MAG: signal peptide peptidase SppA [Crocinitomicaceae bacterium]|nr:signal peptide peptidase SppA [Crocinitomicaceae bacterium]
MSDQKVSFGKLFWPSFVAVMIAGLISLFLFFLVLGGIIGSFGDFGPAPLAIKNSTVLHLKLTGDLKDKSDETFDVADFKVNRTVGLPDLLYGIEKAKTDPKIKGIFLELGSLRCGFASAKELHDAIKDFQKSGKFAVAYLSGEYVSQTSYYISSAAKEVYGFPSTNMEFTGIGVQLMFFKNLLDNLNIEVDIVRGSNNDFKSAVEPFFRTNMSDSSRLQTQTFLRTMWRTMRNDIALNKGLDTVLLDQHVDSLHILDCQSAYKAKLISGLSYRDEFLGLLKKKMGIPQEDELELQSMEKYALKAFSDRQLLVKNQNPNIAVILAEGDVATSGDGISSEKICKLFQKVRNDKNIIAVVFRINSPGGSALASEEIWREVAQTQKKKKVIVSMGDVAASGGYYIATPADRIFAEPTTITGSIGVFGMIPYTGKFMENKLGITFDEVRTNQHSLTTLNKKLTPEELMVIQKQVDKIYTQFLTRVSNGRKMKMDQVGILARGRVWSGEDALRIGLVDELGGLTKAIAYASRKMNNPKVVYFPIVKKNTLSEIADMIEQQQEEDETIQMDIAIPTELKALYARIKKIESMSGIQMRMPFEYVMK